MELPARQAELSGADHHSVLRLGAFASIVQSALFVVIGVAALALGIDPLLEHGFASLAATAPSSFRILCLAFVTIAILGLAITPAERALIESKNAGLAKFGATLAYLGHSGTIGFFSWWLLGSIRDTDNHATLDAIAPIAWGVMFELVFVGAWVWMLAAVLREVPTAPRGFLVISVVKATSFWLTFAAFLLMQKWMLFLGLGAITFVAGPIWHLWMARILLRRVKELAVAQ